MTRFFARDSWFTSDKGTHAVYGFAYWIVLQLVPSFGAQCMLFAAGAVGIEVVQYVRLATWESRGSPQPRPEFSDGFSVRDLVADIAGAGAAFLLLLRLGV